MAAPVAVLRLALRSACIKRDLRRVVFCRTVSSEGKGEQQRDPLPVFMQDEVQTLLKSMTGFDMMKLAGPHKGPLRKPTYKLLTDQELQELQEQARQRISHRLQMPPFMKVRQPVNQVLSQNPELEGLDTAKLVFTDITFGVKNRQRTIVVRDPDGTLRKAEWEERDRINQIYSPVEGRKLHMPPMFHEEELEKLLKEERFVYVLDMACVQFEPDSPDYIRVTHRTFEVVDSQHKYEDLRSTRHFGPMAFYLAWYKKIDYLLIDMLNRDLLSDAQDLVRLYCIIHPDSSVAQQLSKERGDDPLSFVKAFLATESAHKGQLELAVQGVEERQRVSSHRASRHT